MDSTLAPYDRLAHSLVRVGKLLRCLRQQLPRDPSGLDPAAYPILFTLAQGPMRVSALAEAVHSDISTISRQVSALTQQGLIAKDADPDDGRAQVLVLQESAREALATLREHRARIFADYLSDWGADDVARFTTYLDRMGAAITAANAGPPSSQDSR